MKSDKAIEEIRETRKEISAEYDHDAKKLVDHYSELQKKYEKRLQKKEQPEESSAGQKIV
jgi:hypothetical protein